MGHASFSTIKLLFDRGGTIQHGQLLHYAVARDASDCLEVIDFLLDKGAPINDVMYQNRLKDYYHWRRFGLGTPLHYAADIGKRHVVEHLLRRGADPLIKDARGKMAIQRAEEHRNSDVVELLRPLSTPSGPRHDWTDDHRFDTSIAVIDPSDLHQTISVSDDPFVDGVIDLSYEHKMTSAWNSPFYHSDLRFMHAKI